MNGSECVGYFASVMVLETFCMRGMVTLRAMAIASNVAFIAYAAVAGIGPVLLHALLLPMNAFRLWQTWHKKPCPATVERRATGAGAANRLPGARRAMHHAQQMAAQHWLRSPVR